jgi:nucleotide-binding universal stress UspA family protein
MVVEAAKDSAAVHGAKGPVRSSVRASRVGYKLRQRRSPKLAIARTIATSPLFESSTMSTAKTTILVTTDLSQESHRAFAAACDLARGVGARIVVLYVLPTIDHKPTGSPFVSPVPMPGDDELIALAHKDLEALRGHFAGMDVAFEARASNDVDEAVCKCAEDLGASYIVLSSHGRSGLRRMVLGSVAESILRRARVPVLVVPMR